MAQDHDHPADDRPSGETRRSFLYSLSLAGVVALAGCGATPTATSAPRPTATGAAPGGATPARGTATPAAAGGASPVPACVLTPDETEGPYYFNAAQVRRDITDGKPGTPLRLIVTVVDVTNGCQPVRDALVDVWHCDASGLYPGYSGQAPGGGTASGGVGSATPVPGTGEGPGGARRRPGRAPAGARRQAGRAGRVPRGPRRMSPRRRSSCAASRRPTPTARRPSTPSSPAGTRGG